MDDESLIHYGIKGMRWGRGSNDSGGGWSTGAPGAPPKMTNAPSTKPKTKAGVSTTSAKSKESAPPKASRVTKAPVAASPTRSFRDSDGVRSKKQSQMTPAEKAHRKKMILGGVAVVGILGIAAAGATAYKVSPHALGAFDKLNVASQNKVAGALAHPKAVNLKLAGGRKVNAVKMNALFKQAELAQRTSNSPLGSIARQRSTQLKANPRVARVGINQSLGELRRDTEQMKAMNDAEKYVGTLISNRANQRFASEAGSLRKAQVKKTAAKITSTLIKDQGANQRAKELTRVNALMRRKRQLATPANSVGPLFNRFSTPR